MIDTYSELQNQAKKLKDRKIPLTCPTAPKLSNSIERLQSIEESNWLSNYGPVNTELECGFIRSVFDGVGACTTVNNATTGLILALKLAADKAVGKGRYVVMPSFTFAAAAHAVLWAGLTPLLVDIDPFDWAACREGEEQLLREYGDGIAVLMPYATFGSNIDLSRYERLARDHGVGVVVDAASSLGALDENGSAFGIGFPHAIVFSMHATKTFGVGEAGLVYSADTDIIATLRQMANFGFGAERCATMPGLNGKVSEVTALSALIKLPELDRLTAHRAELAQCYRRELPDWTPQRSLGLRDAYQFMPLLMPSNLVDSRETLQARLTELGVGTGHYFSPHIVEQPYFRTRCVSGALPATEAVARRMMSFPMSDSLQIDDVVRVCKAVRSACRKAVFPKSDIRIENTGTPAREPSFGTVIVGGGPAALAPLISASRDGRLDEVLAGGIAIVERGPTIGSGQLGEYGISSDSTADTFMTAVLGHADPRLGVLADHPLCQELRAVGPGAVPLVKAAALMGMIGSILRKAILDAGGAVMVGHEALNARQGTDGRWRTTVRSLEDGSVIELHSDSLILAAGGHQALERLQREPVAGKPLMPTYAGKVVQSDEVLRLGGLAAMSKRLAGIASPTIAIVGGSTSALAASGALLQGLPNETSAAGSITVLHRRALRVFYRSPEDAIAEGYTDFGPDDICPISGFVYRLAGFRTDSRELVMRASGIGGRAAEPRLLLHRIDESHNGETHAILERADVIVAAMGYRPKLLTVYDAKGDEIELAGLSRNVPAVDRECRVLDAAGRPIERLFAIGLAAGFRPSGKFGGEPSFSGQANGLWLWQTAVGAMLIDALQEASSGPVMRSLRRDPKKPFTAENTTQSYRDLGYADNMLLLHCGPALRAANALKRDSGASPSVTGQG